MNRNDPSQPSDNSSPDTARGGVLAAIGRGLRRARVRYMVFIALPTLLVAVYEFGIAADLYKSEAKFGVKGLHPTVSTQGLLGILGGNSAIKSTFDEGLSLQDFYKSRDAVKALQAKMDLLQVYRRPGADFISRLRAHPSLEDLDEYYKRMVDVRFDQQDGVTTIRAYAYRSEDATAIVETLLEAGEDLVNRYSERSREDTLRFSRDEVKAAEQRVEDVQQQLVQFRSHAELIDPNQQSTVVLKLATDIESQLLQTKAAIAEIQPQFGADSPRIQVLRAKERALQEQFDNQYAKLTRESGALAPVMADYEKLQLQREFSNRELEAALASLEAARLEVQRQQMYVVRVVEPVHADESRYPRRWMIVTAALFISALLYGIVSLFVAGVRDHVL